MSIPAFRFRESRTICDSCSSRCAPHWQMYLYVKRAQIESSLERMLRLDSAGARVACVLRVCCDVSFEQENRRGKQSAWNV